MKHTKRLKTLLLAALLTAGLFAGNVYASEIVPETEICAESTEAVETEEVLASEETEEAKESEEVTETDAIEETDSIEETEETAEIEELDPAAAVTGSATVTEAAKVLRAAMVKRQSTVDVPLAVGSSLGPKDAEKILNKAYAHTSKGEEGDYLKRQVAFTQITFDTDSGQTVLHYSFCYITTAAQEAELSAFITAFEEKYQISSRTTNYEKLLAIYEFVCDSVGYDYVRKDNAKVITKKSDFVRSNYIQQTAYAAAINQTAVCEGYATLFYRLAMYYGFDTRIVTGTSYEEPHGWNLVKYNGEYYQVDATKDAGSGREDLRFFLLSEDGMRGWNTLDEESQALVDSLTMADTSCSLKTPKILTSGKYKYVRSYGAVIVSINNSAGGALTIPKTLGGYPVVAMDCSISSDQAMDYHYETTSLTFPEGMYRVKGYYWMFDDVRTVTFASTMVMNAESMNVLSMDNLTTIKLNSGSKTLKVVDNVLFTKDGRNLVKYPPGSTRTSYAIPAGTVYINNGAFRDSTNLRKVTVPDSMEVIDAFAFKRCYHLSSINLPDGLKTIGHWAFGFTNLSGWITLPVGLDWYGKAVFVGSEITGLKMSSGNKFGYFTRNGIVCLDYNREGYKQVIEAPAHMSNPKYSVPDDFLYVAGNSFNGSNIREISLNEGLINIGSCAFENCSELTKVIVPTTVQSIDDRSFGFNEDSLKSVYVLAKNVEIWEDPFSGTETTVYGYKGSTIEEYCKGQDNLTFKEITGPVYNWGVNGERCTVTILNSKGTPVAHPCSITSKKQVVDGVETGVVTYTATYKTSSKTYTSTKTVKADYKLSISSSLTTFTRSTSVKVSGVKESAALTFESSNWWVASVDASGKVIATGVGDVTITVKAAATSHYNAQTASITLHVEPAKTSFSSVTNTSSGISLKWTVNDTADGYKIYRDGKLIKTVTDRYTTSFTNTSSLTSGSSYTYKIVAYAATQYEFEGTIFTASPSEKTIVYLSQPTLSDVTNSAAGTMKVTWGKKSSITGYQIQYSTSSTFASGNKTVTVSGASSVSKTIASLTKGKTYYVRIRTYKTVGDVKYYSAYSAKKSVKITK